MRTTSAPSGISFPPQSPPQSPIAEEVASSSDTQNVTVLAPPSIESQWHPLRTLPFPSNDGQLEDGHNTVSLPRLYAPSLKGAVTWEFIPKFAVITSRNGGGKSQLLEWIDYYIKDKNANNSNLLTSPIRAHHQHSQHFGLNVTDLDTNVVINLSRIFNDYVVYSTKYLKSPPCTDDLSELVAYAKVFQEQKAPWAILNDLLKKAKLDLEVDYQINRIIYSKRIMDKSILIQPEKLSSGERLIIEIFCWLYHAKQSENAGPTDKSAWHHKIDILLLDEPDRHFDPELCKLFMDCLKLISKNAVQIIMTTHRTDTLAFAPKDSIFTIKRDVNDRASIEPTSRLNALFKLTPNLRDITNFYIKVYVESHDDATVYERVYRQLLAFSAKEREKGKMTDTTKPIILSRRFQLSFYSIALNKDATNGGSSHIPPKVKRDMVALDHLDTIEKKKEADKTDEIKSSASLFPRRITYPLALMDRDFGEDKIKDYKGIQSQFFYTTRHSVENYIYDPVFLFSLLKEEEIRNRFKDNHFIKKAIACRRAVEACNALDEDTLEYVRTEKQKELNKAFKDYFNYFLQCFLTECYPDIAMINEQIGPQKDKPSVGIQQYLCIPKVAEKINAFLIAKSSQTKKKKSLTEEESPQAKFLTLDLLAKNLGIGHELDKQKVEQIATLLIEDIEEIKILSSKGRQLVTISYPKFFIYLRGHNLEYLVQHKFVKDKDVEGVDFKFKDWVIDQLAIRTDSLALPMDLVQVIRNINTRAREQAREAMSAETIKADGDERSEQSQASTSVESLTSSSAPISAAESQSELDPSKSKIDDKRQSRSKGKKGGGGTDAAASSSDRKGNKEAKSKNKRGNRRGQEQEE